MSIFKHSYLLPLEPNSRIWRYLDFEKFKSLLETKSLFFCRADKFSDPFEGSLPKLEIENRKKFMREISQFPGYDFGDKQINENISSLQEYHINLKRATIINCWHINKNESDAMWRLYLKDNEGVAIQSTTERIYNTIEVIPEVIGLSKVRYLDYETGFWYDPIQYPHWAYNSYSPIIHKRIEFVHENEFRLFCEVKEAIDNENYWDNQPNAKGKFIQVNLNTLIERIYLPPTIHEKSYLKIEQISKDLGYKFLFTRSKLSQEVLY